MNKNTITYLLDYPVAMICFIRCDTRERKVEKMRLLDLNWKFYYGIGNIPVAIKYNDRFWQNIIYLMTVIRTVALIITFGWS